MKLYLLGYYFQMYGDKKQYQNQIIPKKSRKTSDQEVDKRKGKKNKRRQQWQQPSQNYQRQPRQHQSQFSLNQQSKIITKKKEEQQVFNQLCTILSSYKPSTIRKVLIENDFKKTESINILFQMAPDNEEEYQWRKQSQKISKLQAKKGSQDKSSSTDHSQIANNLLNQVYDNFLKEDIQQINGKQFEELFEQIAQLIKEDQRDRGMGMFQINNFVDECNSVKQTLLIGFREELSNFDDFEFDQSYPLYTQTQLFLQTTIKKQAKQQKKLQQDFPMLGMSSKDSKPQKSIIERIHHQKKKQKQEGYLFTPSKNVHSQYARQKSNEASIFNVDNKYKSERDLMSLHKQFFDVPVRDLKFVYKTFVGDYNICRQFLIKYYDDKRSKNFQPTKTSVSAPKTVATRIHTSRMKKEEIDEELKHLSLKEIREEIDHLFKLRQALQLTKMKIKSSNQKQELDRMINEKNPLIRKLSQASRVKEVQQMRRTNPLYIDLHGYREEEIDPLLDTVTDMIREEYDQRSSKVNTKKVKGRLTACLVVMTGKGIHSRGNRSILKPATADWCKGKDFDYEEEDDHLRVYIVVG